MSIAPTPAHQAVASVTRTRPATAFTPSQNGVEPVAAFQTTDKPIKEDKPFSFWDLVDIVNPLQHIPVVSTFYRQITGDEIGNFARIAGGGLFGGFLGAAAGGVNAIMVTQTGKDVGDTIVSAVMGDDTLKQSAPSVQTATADTELVTSQLPQSEYNKLFYGHLNTSSAKTADAVKDIPAKPTMPLIEVRPHPIAPEFSQSRDMLPKSQNIAQLPDYEAPASPKPVAKENVQQAMMDALLKMQADDSKDEKESSVD